MATFAVIEVPARFGDTESSLAWLDNILPDVRADVVLLPETCLTGYVSPQGEFDLQSFAEPLNGPLARALAKRAQNLGIHLGWPLVERDGTRFFNSYCISDPAGQLVAHYRKRHPWYPETWAAAGEEPYPVCTIAGVEVTIAVCFDIHFLADEAAEVLDRVDVLLFPSAWVEAEAEPDGRNEIFAALTRRFGVGIVNANWGPGDVVLAGQGGSRIVGPDGREVARAGICGVATGAL
jgi:predicted amidohydrolase